MRRVEKRTEQDEKYLPLCSLLKFKYFNFCEIFSQQNQSDFFLVSRGPFTRIKKFSQNGGPTALSGLREDRHQYILKTRVTKLQTSFRFRQFFAGTLKPDFHSRFSLVASEFFCMGHAQNGEMNRTGRKNIFRSVRI